MTGWDVFIETTPIHDQCSSFFRFPAIAVYVYGFLGTVGSSGLQVQNFFAKSDEIYMFFVII